MSEEQVNITSEEDYSSFLASTILQTLLLYERIMLSLEEIKKKNDQELLRAIQKTARLQAIIFLGSRDFLLGQGQEWLEIFPLTETLATTTATIALLQNPGDIKMHIFPDEQKIGMLCSKDNLAFLKQRAKI